MLGSRFERTCADAALKRYACGGADIVHDFFGKSYIKSNLPCTMDLGLDLTSKAERLHPPPLAPT